MPVTHDADRICTATTAGRFGVFHINSNEIDVTVDRLMAGGVTNDAPVALRFRVRRRGHEQGNL
ncbi:hypothetical protein [Maritimibacter fusiformis]|uniref:Uncharacterized protein n=1 Tax=Maritimibacter fusiformis TaxID=2603819 RepID=A0A5D0RJE7_9RHOB|nr:hypothetical protein [Maritimibacter fusiformis]TYB81747.1 hypothetical protein FVF75_08555 [Maritimibacter fusiformis]